MGRGISSRATATVENSCSCKRCTSTFVFFYLLLLLLLLLSVFFNAAHTCNATTFELAQSD